MTDRPQSDPRLRQQANVPRDNSLATLNTTRLLSAACTGGGTTAVGRKPREYVWCSPSSQPWKGMQVNPPPDSVARTTDQ